VTLGFVRTAARVRVAATRRMSARRSAWMSAATGVRMSATAAGTRVSTARIGMAGAGVGMTAAAGVTAGM
jgi:hypothetical protein